MARIPHRGTHFIACHQGRNRERWALGNPVASAVPPCLESSLVIIRVADKQDWPRIYPFFSSIVAAGRTYAFPENLSLQDARPWWMEQPPGLTVVAVDGDTVLGTAKMGPIAPAEART